MKKWLTILGLSILFWSCQDVVEVDVPESEPELVIDGWVTDSLPTEVRLSTTAPFFSEGQTPRVSGALVRLFENDSLVATLNESNQEQGLYLSSYRGRVGSSYHVEVEVPSTYAEPINGGWRSRAARMKRITSIDSINIRNLNRNTQPPAFSEGEYALLYFQEIPGEGDIINVSRFLNDSIFQRDIFILEDTGLDGFYIGDVIPPVGAYGPFRESDEGDTLRIRFESITEDYASFLGVLSEQVFVGSPFDAPPALVVGNIHREGDTLDYAFGYFRASALSGTQIIYQP